MYAPRATGSALASFGFASFPFAAATPPVVNATPSASAAMPFLAIRDCFIVVPLWSKRTARTVAGVGVGVKNPCLNTRGVTRQHRSVVSRFTRVLIALFATCWLASCATTTAAVVKVPSPGAIVPDPHKATIVVIQPSSRLRAVNLIDGHGRLVAQLDDRSHTVVRVTEGPTLLYAVVENRPDTADRLEGTLMSGYVYYATVSERSGGVALVALTPRSPEGRWGHKSEYLAHTPRLELDPESIGRTVNELGNVVPIMEAADARVATMSSAEQAERQYQESDGGY